MEILNLRNLKCTSTPVESSSSKVVVIEPAVFDTFDSVECKLVCTFYILLKCTLWVRTIVECSVAK